MSTSSIEPVKQKCSSDFDHSESYRIVTEMFEKTLYVYSHHSAYPILPKAPCKQYTQNQTPKIKNQFIRYINMRMYLFFDVILLFFCC
jgi:hypothetical protein